MRGEKRLRGSTLVYHSSPAITQAMRRASTSLALPDALSAPLGRTAFSRWPSLSWQSAGAYSFRSTRYSVQLIVTGIPHHVKSFDLFEHISVLGKILNSGVHRCHQNDTLAYIVQHLGIPSRIRQIHTIVLAVLTLPDQPAAMTRPFSTATKRIPDTANSRSSTMASTHAAKCPPPRTSTVPP